MATLYIEEFSVAVREDGNEVQCAQQPSIATQAVDFTAGVTPSAAFNTLTKFVRITSDSICSYKFGTAPVAVVTDPRLSLGAVEYFGVIAGQKVSAIVNT